MGGTRYPIIEIEDDAIHGPVRAGEESFRRLEVEVEALGAMTLLRVLPDGGWRAIRTD